jgi:hypothetical protein
VAYFCFFLAGSARVTGAIGAPQFGHDAALSETSLPHSSQLINAMPQLPSL